MSKRTRNSRVSPGDIMAAKGGRKLICLTAYTAPVAGLLDPHCDILLVGDSVGMVVHGLPDTTGVTVDMMALHGAAVMRGSARALVVVDLPFGSYEESPEQAYRTSVRLVQETGCQAVKLEYNPGTVATTKFLVDRGIPVIGHVGLRPQAVKAAGGFKVVGKSADSRAEQVRSAVALADAGAFALVVEGVPEDLAVEITQAVDVPTIGIGASAACDGQILVTDDMLGLFDWTPKFVRRYADLRGDIESAVKRYAEDVESGGFPGVDEVYKG